MAEHDRRADDHLEGRMARNEAQIDSLTHSVTELADSVRSGFHSIQKRLDEVGRPAWGNLIAGIGLFVTIAALAFAPVWMVIGYHNSRIGEISRWKLETAAELGKRGELMNRNRVDIRHLDEVLQREMRLLDDAMQREMRLLDEATGVETKQLRKEIDWLWQIVHDITGMRRPLKGDG